MRGVFGILPRAFIVGSFLLMYSAAFSDTPIDGLQQVVTSREPAVEIRAGGEDARKGRPA